MSGRVRLDRGELPWAPLVAGGEGLNRYETPDMGLSARMAALYGVAPGCVLPVAGVGRALAMIADVAGAVARFDHPDADGALLAAAPGGPAVIVEERIEFAPGEPSFAARAAGTAGLFVVRSLDVAYGLAGAGGIAAIIAQPEAVRRLAALGPGLATLPARLARAALAPERMPASRARIATVIAERERVGGALAAAASAGNFVVLERVDHAALARAGIAVERRGAGARVTIGTPEENDLLLAALGVAVPARAAARRAEVVRDTKETRIVCAVDLDRGEPVHIATGIGFFDHMLEQVARHGGFSCMLACEGDLDIEAHHTIEDCSIALGEALRRALGDRAGVARFGFTAPLDEALAQVVIDLSGRPFLKFDGVFARPMIGDYATEMTAHVFRSLADAMRATLHVTVTGEDDHHKTEAAFKAFGRALRMAVRVEGGGVPSTKGVLA